MSAFFLAVPGLIVARRWLASTGLVATSDWQEWFVLAEGAVVAVVAAVAAGALVWARRKRLGTAESVRLLFGATTASASWNAPEIARLLAPASGGVRPPDRDAPADFRRAISDLLPLLPRETQDAARAAAAAADRAVRAIEERDRELGALARDAGAGEVDRLSAQLAAFGDDAPEDTPEHRELRELVRHQLELVRRLHARHEAVSRQRARLLDLLRGLWTQLGAVRDSATVGPESVTQVAKRVAAICAEIDGTLAAAPGAQPIGDSPATTFTR